MDSWGHLQQDQAMPEHFKVAFERIREDQEEGCENFL